MLALSVSMTGAEAVTSMVFSRPPTFISMSAVTVASVRTETPRFQQVSKPVSLAQMVYLPGGRYRNLYWPLASVTVDLGVIMASLSMSMVTPGRASPFWSVTNPRSVPVV